MTLVADGTRQDEGGNESTRAPRRRRRRPEAPQLVVDFIVPATFRAKVSREWIKLVTVRAMLTHILYARGIVPTPVLEIIKRFEEIKGDRVSRANRSMLKCGASLTQLLQQWTDLVGSGHEIGAILISLGPSWSRPCEQYLLQLNNLGQDAASQTSLPTLPTNQQEHTLSRRLVTSFMNATNGSEDQDTADFMAKPSRGASSYQMHLSVWVSKEASEKLFESNARLLVRHEFRLVQQAKKKVPASITTRVRVPEIDSTIEWDEGVWMTLPTVVKGFRLQGSK